MYIKAASTSMGLNRSMRRGWPTRPIRDFVFEYPAGAVGYDQPRRRLADKCSLDLPVEEQSADTVSRERVPHPDSIVVAA